MSLPLYMKDAFGFPTAAALATAIGFAFGFVLERAGFGRASVLAAQFYFNDNRVLKVMFSAIVTAMLGVVILSGLGLLDLSAMTIPETFLWPQVLGGLLLGIGFVMSGYCPGTSVVAAASGKLDGVITVLGVILGSLLFGLAYPFVESFHLSGAMGAKRFPDLLGIPAGLVAAGVVAMAVGAFLGVEKLEIAVSRRRAEAAPAGSPALRNRALAGFAVAGALALATIAMPRANDSAAAIRTVAPIDALELARMLIEDPSGSYLVDLRGSEAYARAHIPGAMVLAPQEDPGEFFAALSGQRRLVVYGDAGSPAVPEGAARFAGEVRVLTGGYEAFARAILQPPIAKPDPTAQDIAQYRLLSALHARFTESEAPSTPAAPVLRRAQAAGAKKGGGCS